MTTDSRSGGRRTFGRPIAAALCAAAACALVAPRAEGTGGSILLKTDNGFDGYYYRLSGTGSDLYITEYLAADAQPRAVICGARIFELNQGMPIPGQLTCELRLEDAANPGYPDMTSAGLFASADLGSLGPCLTSVAAPRMATFNGGAGVPWPNANHYVVSTEPRHGPGTLDFCGILLDTSSPPLRAAKTRSAGTFGVLPWNHFLEENVGMIAAFSFRVRYHGNRRFPGDPGSTVVYGLRANAAGQTTDDRVRLTFAVDNNTASPATFELEFGADLTGLVVGGGFVPLTARFRPVGGGAPVTNPVSFPPGRTILRLEIPAALPMRASRLAPLNIPFTFRAVDTATQTQLAFIVQELGLRATPGEADDGSPEAFFVPRSPVMASDALAVRFRGIDLPRSAPFSVTGVQLAGGEFGGSGLPGFDAVEVRTADAVLAGTPDLSPGGLVAAVGAADGVGEVAMGPPPWFRALDVPDVSFDARGLPSGIDLYGQVLFLPGDTAARATMLAADQMPGRTLLSNSFLSLGGTVPYVADPNSNYVIRLLLDGRIGTLEDGRADGDGRRRPFGREVGRFIPIDRFGR